MGTIISLATRFIITIMLLIGAGYAAKMLLLVVQKATFERIAKGLSSTEELTKKLTE